MFYLEKWNISWIKLLIYKLIISLSLYTNSNEIVEAVPLSWKFWKKRRYVVVFLAFLGFFNVYSLRVNLSVAIVAMTENRTVIDDAGNISYEQDFPWDSKQRGLILSSFFYGYITTQFIGGFIGAKIGGNIVSECACALEFLLPWIWIIAYLFLFMFLLGIWLRYRYHGAIDAANTLGR